MYPTTVVSVTVVSVTAVLMGTISALIPMLLVIGVLALITGRLPEKLSISRKRGWLIAHIVFVIVFFTGIIGCLLLVIMTTFVHSGNLIYAAHFFIVYFDYLAIAGAFGALLTGTWLAARTNWGLTKHHWVITKLIGTLLTTILGSSILAIGEEDSLFETIHGTINPLQNQAYLHYREIYFAGIVLQLAVMFFLVFITILKPWGKRKEAVNKATTC